MKKLSTFINLEHKIFLNSLGIFYIQELQRVMLEKIEFVRKSYEKLLGM